MPHAGQEIEGFGGMRMRFVAIDDELLDMDVGYSGDGGLPPEHLHPSQAERFEVLEGRFRTIVGGEEREYGAGEAFDVPAGTPHQMAALEPGRVRWQVRPALRTAEFFERLYGDGPGTPRGGMPVEDFLAEFSAEFRLTQQG
jgi:hypothetical protein